MQATHPERFDLLFLALAAIAALFVWHSRPGRAARRWIWSACTRPTRFAAVGALGIMAAIGVLMAVFVAYFSVRSWPRHDARTKRSIEFQTSMAAHESDHLKLVRALGFDPIDAPNPPSPPKQLSVHSPKHAEKPVSVEAPEDESTELASAISVRPDPKPLPDWAEKPYTRRVGESYRSVVIAGPHTTLEDVEDELDEKLPRAVAKYVQSQIARRSSFHMHMPVSMSFINDRLVADRFDQTVALEGLSIGEQPMVQSYVLLEFDDSARRDLEQMWRSEVVSNRLWHTGILGGLMLTVLGTIYSYLRLDTLSKGYYSIRLRMAAAAVISAAVAVGWFFASFKALV